MVVPYCQNIQKNIIYFKNYSDMIYFKNIKEIDSVYKKILSKKKLIKVRKI